MELSTLSLLTVDAIPEAADCVFIYAPASDISAAEKEMLADYVAQGGRLLVMAGPAEGDGLKNLYALLSDYGVEAQDGIVVEGDREHYAFQTPYALLPELNNHAVTDSLIDEGYKPILPIARGLIVGETTGGATVTELLTMKKRTATLMGPLPWRCLWSWKAAVGWSGSPPPISWRICTTPIPPEPTRTWP